MKTQYQLKESLVDFARRSMKFADAMDRIVRAVFSEGKEVLVYPNDNITKVLSTMKIQSILMKFDSLKFEVMEHA